MNSCHAEKQIHTCGCAEGQFPSDAEICNLRNSSTGENNRKTMNRQLELDRPTNERAPSWLTYYQSDHIHVPCNDCFENSIEQWLRNSNFILQFIIVGVEVIPQYHFAHTYCARFLSTMTYYFHCLFFETVLGREHSGKVSKKFIATLISEESP